MTKELFATSFAARILLVCLLAGSFSSAAYATGNSLKKKPTRTGEVYLFRGTGAVFSGGLDVLARKLTRKGVLAKVHVHQAWGGVARNILKRVKKRQVSYPIIIMGHSAGGRAALKLAKSLTSSGIAVRYLVTFDPNTRDSVSRNVRKVVNYYLPNATNSNKLLRGRGFRGSIQNINVSNMAKINHLNMEDNLTIQNRVVRTALSFTRRR